MNSVPQCVCPFCGTYRQHEPPRCNCFPCANGTKRPASHRVTVKVADIPQPYKDVAELLVSSDGPAKYEAMIRNARPGLSWMIAHLDDVHHRNLKTLEGTVLACEDMVDALLNQPPIARGQYVRELSEKLQVPEREIRQTLNQVIRERTKHYEQHPEDRPKPVAVWNRDKL